MAERPAPEGAEMNQLRQEAIHRAREMQSRAQIPPVPYSAPPPEKPADPPHPHVEQMPIHPKQGNRNPAPAPAPLPSLGNALDFLTKDSEQSLLMILLLILMEEKSDSSLLFALMYLLL